MAGIRQREKAKQFDGYRYSSSDNYVPDSFEKKTISHSKGHWTVEAHDPRSHLHGSFKTT